MNTTYSRLLLAGLLTFTALSRYASRVVTDQIGRQVTIHGFMPRT
ncbi:hypothetical protein [Pantoea sp. RIT-PI-b]|nr:hypothetical protein [Pantoea sp. RIT-PI-b]